MTQVNDLLAQLHQARASYKDYVEAVDADLKREKERRLAARQSTILELIARAWVEGASKRAIMQAYDTKDFRTIQKVLDSMEEQIEMFRAERDGLVTNGTWFEVASPELVYINGIGFDIIELEDHEYLLDQVEGEPSPWDGSIVRDTGDTDDAAILGAAIKQAKS